MRTNIRQVAAMAGVSRTTVSNVLLGKEGKISPEKREAVLRAVEQLGYVPVRPSLQNRAGATRVLALALHDPILAEYEFHSQVYAGICAAALENDYDVLTVLRSDPEWAVNRTAVRLLDRRSDGIIFFPNDKDHSATLKALVQHGIPAVTCYQRDVPEGIAWVDPDNVGAIQLLVNHLVSQGHQRIIHVTYNIKTQYDFRVRSEAFPHTVEAAGLAPLGESIIEAKPAAEFEIARRVLQTGATAVICANDDLAFTLWDAFTELGVRVPDDISLVGIDNSLRAARRGLTTIDFSYARVGGLAVGSLIKLIEGKSASEASCELEAKLVIRDSVKRR